jgi:starch synthase
MSAGIKSTTTANSGSPQFKKLKILMVAAEASPYASVGGAASVIGNLSKSLQKLGHEVAVFIPKFGFIDEEKYKISMFMEGIKVPTDDESLPFLGCNVKMAEMGCGVKVFFLENHEYYEKRANVYGYSDDPTRWALFVTRYPRIYPCGWFCS